jgi:long-chain acyl-CoA synthetase
MIVGGDDKKFVSALIVPSFSQLNAWAKEQGLPAATPQEMVHDNRVYQLIHKEVKKYNEDFGNWEQVKKFVLLDTEWSVESGELTPTMKPKRKIIMQRYQLEIERMYAAAE